MVYGVINTGYYEKAILFNPYSNSYELIEAIDKETKELRCLYECINSEDNGWVVYERAFLLKLKKYLSDNSYTGEIKLYRGYKEVFDDSTLDKILYEEDYGKRQLKVTFNNSGWYGIVELCFDFRIL